MQGVKVMAPAKLNLSLDIVGRFSNGYHDLDMVMQAVDLFDEVSIQKSSSFQVSCPGIDVNDMDNIAAKAALAFHKAVGTQATEKISIVKKIPSQAGMAGGSADAAAVLSGLNKLYGQPLSVGQLLRIGETIGADVPFSLMGGLCRVRGVGNVLQPLPFTQMYTFVVVMPSFGISTPGAFSAFDKKKDPYHPNVQNQVDALCQTNYESVCANAGNSLQQVSKQKKIEEICEHIVSSGADRAIMTGSGAAVFGFFSTKEKAQSASIILKQHYKNVFVLSPIPFGALDAVKPL